MINPREIVDAMLTEVRVRSLETHNGWLMNSVLHHLRDYVGIQDRMQHYTADGMTATFFYPKDGKVYRITIQEDRRHG